jgi:hypothetical protein
MTRLTEATETFTWARDIDWSEGASAMRSGEEHLKKQKALYLKRKEVERRTGIKSIKKSRTVHGAGSRFCQKFSKLSFSGGKLSKTREEKIFFSTKVLRAHGIFDHSGFTGRRANTPFGVKLSHKEGQTHVHIEINRANLNLVSLLERGGFVRKASSGDHEDVPLNFVGTTQYLIALLPAIEMALKDKHGRLCTSDFFLLENFFPRIQGLLGATIEAMTVGTSIRAQAWERFHKPDKDAKIIHPNIYHSNGKPRPDCILITRDCQIVKANRLSPLRLSPGKMLHNNCNLGITANGIQSNGSTSMKRIRNSDNEIVEKSSLATPNIKLPSINYTKTSPRSSKQKSSALIENNEGLKGTGISTKLQHKLQIKKRPTKTKYCASKYKIPTYGRGASNCPLTSPYVVRNLPSVDVKALRGLPKPLLKFGQEIDAADGIAYNSIPTWSP